MADSLDDFFAKKDKKRKNKSQTAALSAETLVRELGEGAKTSDYSSRRDNKTSAAMEILGLVADDNDWKDFEEVEKRDYTGLKVKEMSIQDQEEEQRRITDQVEQVPESKPWKSKEETVAAIISAKDEMYPSELIESADATTDSTKTITAAPITASVATDDSDTNKAVSSSTQDPGVAANDPPEATTDEKPAEDKPKPVDEAAKNESDVKPPIVRAPYVPPGERLEKESKVLEPVKLNTLRTQSSRFRASININDIKDFPGLG